MRYCHSMYGKSFESMYHGSMYGSGLNVWAVWNYVIAAMKPDSEVGFQVELNPRILKDVFACKEADILDAIAKLCAPDPRSRTKDEDGRKLVRLGEFDFRVVNGVKYDKIKREDDRRRANRERQQKYREKTKPTKDPIAFPRVKSKALPGEISAVKRFEETGIMEDRPVDGEPYQANGI